MIPKSEDFWRSDKPTTQNHYFVATEHGHEAAASRGRGEVDSAGVQAGCAASLLFSDRLNATK